MIIAIQKCSMHRITNRYCLHLCTKIDSDFLQKHFFLSPVTMQTKGIWNFTNMREILDRDIQANKQTLLLQ